MGKIGLKRPKNIKKGQKTLKNDQNSLFFGKYCCFCPVPEES